MLDLVTTKPTDAEFLTLFNRLAVALRLPADDSGVTVGVYFDALHDVSIRALEAGALVLMRQPGRRFFPTTAEWREVAEAEQIKQLRSVLTSPREEPWKVECADCEDTGWSRFACAGGPVCGREKTHAPHSYVRVCPCRPTNRTWQRHQRFGSGA